MIDIHDTQGPGGERIGALTYDELLAQGDPEFAYTLPNDEWDALALNYTSGTTGRPKGVVYSHRGAWTNTVNNVITWEMPHHPVYLWTLATVPLQRLVLSLDDHTIGRHSRVSPITQGRCYIQCVCRRGRHPSLWCSYYHVDDFRGCSAGSTRVYPAR